MIKTNFLHELIISDQKDHRQGRLGFDADVNFR